MTWQCTHLLPLTNVPLKQWGHISDPNVFSYSFIRNSNTLYGLLIVEIIVKNNSTFFPLFQISEKYEVPLEKLGKVYKKCKKG